MKTNDLIQYLASVLSDHFNITLEDVENAESEADKEILYGFICLHEDLKFYKKQSEKLLENFKSTLFNSAAITVCNSRGVITEVNHQFEILTGYTSQEIIGEKSNFIDSTEQEDINYSAIRKDIKHGKTWRGEIKCIHKNGAPFWIHSNVFPIKNTAGDIYEYWSVSSDITERKKMEIELKAKNDELMHFSYILSHDLKAPILGVKNLAAFIKEDLEDENYDELKDHVEKMFGRADRMIGLIQGIMDFAKIGMVQSNKEHIDLNDLVEDIFYTVNKKPNMKLVIETPLPNLFEVPVIIDQLFSNLISNAIKYNDKEYGVVKIGFEETSKGYVFTVTDNGPGIAEEFYDKIFQVFQTLNRRDRFESTGIGLSIVDKIIKQIGGTISVRSELSKGTTFEFLIPQKVVSK